MIWKEEKMLKDLTPFSSISWFCNLNAKQSSSQRIVDFSSKIICDQVRSVSLFCDHLMLHKVKSILENPEHALYREFEVLPHGRRFRSLVCKTNRFVPTEIRLLSRPWSALFTNYSNTYVSAILCCLPEYGVVVRLRFLVVRLRMCPADGWVCFVDE